MRMQVMGSMMIVQNDELIYDDDDDNDNFDDDCTSNKWRWVGRRPPCTCFEKLFQRSSSFVSKQTYSIEY